MTRRVWAAATVVLLAGCGQWDRPVRYDDYPSFARAEVVPAFGGEAPAEAAADLSEQADLDDYLVYAAMHNPQLEAAFHRWKAALEQIPQVTALPDPQFTYRYYIREMETRASPPRQAVALQQTFPWFGKLQLRGDAAAEMAEMERQTFQAEKLRLFQQVKDAYYEYAYLWQAISITEENARLLKYFEEVVRIRYRTATADNADIVRAQVEQGKLADRLRTLGELAAPLAARLNAALNRPPDAPLARPAPAAGDWPAFSDEQWLAWMRESNPRLAGLDRQIDQERVGIELARKEYFPDVMLEVDWDHAGEAMEPSDSGKDEVIASVSVNLPIWRDKLDAGVRQARRRHSAAVGQRTAAENALTADLKMALFRYRDAERKINLYRDTLLPKARQSIQATERAYKDGSNTFLELIDAQRVLLEFELAYQRALADRAQRLAELERLTGRQWPASGNPSPPVSVTTDEAVSVSEEPNE